MISGRPASPPEAGAVRSFSPRPRTRGSPARARLAWLHLISRRVPAGAAVIAGSAAGLRIALVAPWDAYGALQLPLVFETVAAAAVIACSASPFGEPERVAGRRLPWLRLATALLLSTVAAGALAAAGAGAHLSGGTIDVLRNVLGIVGLGLICAAAAGASVAWAGPTSYLVAGVYALYTQWHGPALTTPWIWPARPPHDIGAALCAGLVFVAGTVLVTIRGARDRSGQHG
jgi:hypothetical protein